MQQIKLSITSLFIVLRDVFNSVLNMELIFKKPPR